MQIKIQDQKPGCKSVSTIAEGVNYSLIGIGQFQIALKEAARRKCYKETGITNPMEDIDVIEIYDAFTSQHLIWLEALGLCDVGKAASQLIDSGVTRMDGKLPVNPSGGVLI
jgi:acetyl-CoA acetyltransferase